MIPVRSPLPVMVLPSGISSSIGDLLIQPLSVCIYAYMNEYIHIHIHRDMQKCIHIS
jgi:hypothetical protein